MDISTRQWLLAELGPTTDLLDLDTRLTRLRYPRAVAIEVLRERLATMVSQPAVLGVSGVLNVSYAQNIAALQQQIAGLQDPDGPPAPGEPGFGAPIAAPTTGISTFRLHERPRR